MVLPTHTPRALCASFVTNHEAVVPGHIDRMARALDRSNGYGRSATHTRIHIHTHKPTRTRRMHTRHTVHVLCVYVCVRACVRMCVRTCGIRFICAYICVFCVCCVVFCMSLCVCVFSLFCMFECLCISYVRMYLMFVVSMCYVRACVCVFCLVC